VTVSLPEMFMISCRGISARSVAAIITVDEKGTDDVILRKKTNSSRYRWPLALYVCNCSVSGMMHTQWRFYVGARGAQAPPNLCQAPQNFWNTTIMLAQ
jgi:hypothetical protein